MSESESDAVAEPATKSPRGNRRWLFGGGESPAQGEADSESARFCGVHGTQLPLRGKDCPDCRATTRAHGEVVDSPEGLEKTRTDAYCTHCGSPLKSLVIGTSSRSDPTRITISMFSRQGLHHDRCEDAVLAGPTLIVQPSRVPVTLDLPLDAPTILAVMDGIGGHQAGDRASKMAGMAIAREGFRPDVPSATELADLLTAICVEITTESLMRPDLQSMGTTVAGVWLGRKALHVFNVGDSRVYGLREGYLVQLSTDHVADEQMVNSSITQALGGGLLNIDPAIQSLRTAECSSYVICTDGFYRHVGDDAIERALKSSDPAGRLWEMSEGASDDASVLLFMLSSSAGPTR